MKVRESDMPSEDVWESFFEPFDILRTLEVDSTVVDAAEFGCGYGTFTIPAAKIISGVLYAVDIDPEKVERVKERARIEGLTNIVAMVRDFLAEGSGIDDASVDYVMLFNILHDEAPRRILDEAYRILRPGGKAGVIHWQYSRSTPRGPSMDIRPSPEQCHKWALQAGFSYLGTYDLKPYHYGLLFQRRLKERTP
ncbi:MAG: class I SAM-dependent methyltransferase [Halobacteriota archaeon]